MDINDYSSKKLQEKIAKLNERNENRKAQETRRRKERFEYGSHAEQAEVFSDTFKEHRKLIERQLSAANEAALSGESRNKLTIRLDDIIKSIDSLKKYLTESSMFLTAFDNEQAKIEFQEIMTNFNRVRDSVLPKQKFGFNFATKTAKKSNIVTDGDDEKLDESIDNNNKPEESIKKSVNPTEQIDIYNCGFIDQSNQSLRLVGRDVDDRDVTLRSLSECRVEIVGHPGSVYIHKLVDCVVIIGPTNRSVFIDDCRSCRFYFACQQGRIHNTVDSDFYLHVTSRAIIEDCRGLRFAPYLLEYSSIESDFRESRLDTRVNNWDKIEDFRHLVAGVASPNWAVLPDDCRESVAL